MSQQAFVLRIAPSGNDRVPEALSHDELIIGWSKAEGLLDPALAWRDFRELIRFTYYGKETTLHKAGAAAGHMWRFIRDMQPGDLVVVPHGAGFHVAEVQGPAVYFKEKRSEDSAYRRKIRWLNDKTPIPRSIAKAALISRMKTQSTCASATDLIEQIRECIEVARAGRAPTFCEDLNARLVRETLAELRGGRIDSFGFENLIKSVLMSLGARDAYVVPRSKDKGADILATFLIAGTFQQVVAVQAKHWQAHPPVGKSVVEQLISGIDAAEANLGMIVTTGSISQEAVEAAERYFEEERIRIELIDGEQFAKLLIESGVGES